MRFSKHERRYNHLFGIAAGITGALVLTACASAPPAPAAAMDAAKVAISNAERAEAGRYAAVELAEARTKIASADDAVLAKKMVMAEQLAEQSRTEAELASARTDAAKAKAELDWSPSHPGLVDEFRKGSYRNGVGTR